jgi:hypothetical protein
VESPVAPLVDTECGATIHFDVAHLCRINSANDFKHLTGPQIPDGYRVGTTFRINGRENCRIGLTQKLVSLFDIHWHTLADS